MSEAASRALLDERWSALGSEEVSGEHRLRVAYLHVVADEGPLAIAVDHDGHRHLLVPIHAHRRVRPGLDGPVLMLRKRPLEDSETYQNYVDLACLRDDLDDLFTELCVDVLDAVEVLPANPVKALYRVLDRWKALFQTQTTLLGTERLAGLFGELMVLNKLLERDPSAHRLWRGPTGHRHDFSTGITAIEVKSTVLESGRRPRIHGLDQLEAPSGGTLGLAWFRLQHTATDGAGTAFTDLVDRVRHLCDDEFAVLGLLATAGYRPADAERYHDSRFVVAEERWYRVDEDFPGLTGQELAAAGVPVSVLDVEYSIDLSGEVPLAMEPHDVSQMIDGMIGETA